MDTVLIIKLTNNSTVAIQILKLDWFFGLLWLPKEYISYTANGSFDIDILD